MKLKNIFSFALLFVAALFMSCSDSDDNNAATGLTITNDGVTIESLSMPLGESSVMLGVNTDAEWTVSVPEADASWISVTPHEGYGWNISDSTASNYRSYFKVTTQKNVEAPRTSTLTITAGGLTKVITVNQAGISGTDDGHESAWEMVENFVLGYNLGNTMESNPYGNWWKPEEKTVADWEKAWGQPQVTKETIQTLKAKGFNALRLPVTWYPHIAKFSKTYTKDEDYAIDAAWMARVKEIVKMINDEGMYCIVNIQHDAGAKNGSGDPNSAWLHADNDYENVTKIYQAIWKQIATEMKDFDDKVIFESFNEILNAKSSWTVPAAGDVAYETINKLQQDFVNVVRATGGNNEYRNLLISCYGDGGGSDASVNAMSVPTDTHPNHICATFHSYDPFWFCNGNRHKEGESAEEKKKIDEDEKFYIYDFGDDQKAEIKAIFNRIDKKCGSLGIPYFFGEFGAIGDHPEMTERAKYADYVTSLCNEYKTTAFWWMGLLDRSTNTWLEDEAPIVDALVKNRVK